MLPFKQSFPASETLDTFTSLLTSPGAAQEPAEMVGNVIRLDASWTHSALVICFWAVAGFHPRKKTTVYVASIKGVQSSMNCAL